MNRRNLFLLSIAGAIIGMMLIMSMARSGESWPQVSQKACPVETITVLARDGNKANAVIRKPPGKGPFPAVIYLHGGLSHWPLSRMQQQSLGAPTLSRYLAAGYVTAVATFRDRNQDPLTSVALWDCLALIDHIKKMPEVDPKGVVLYGTSGGGSLALELAGETDLCAIAVEEPATVLFTGLYSKENLGGKPPFAAGSGMHIMRDPKRYYTAEVQQNTRKKISKISCPVLIAHGDKHIINKINNEIFLPEMKQVGIKVEAILYPGMHHGFSRTSKKFFDDSDAFFKRHLQTRPVALADALIRQVQGKE